MKKRGFLKKIMGVLCVSAFISMPVNADAAEKEEVVGEWVGGWASVTFDEDGNAKDPFNTKPYKIESGSLTVKDVDTGSTETVDYDLWRGYKKPSDVTDAESADAVLYKITEPGRKMTAWNVFKAENDSDWQTYGPATITKVEKAGTGSSGPADKGSVSLANTDTVSQARKCEHNYEWTVTTEPTETADGESSYMCTSCGDIKARQPVSADVVIRKNLLASIKNAEAGTTVSFSNKAWLCYPQYMLDALKEKGDISLKTDFTYEGKNYSFTIPAGSDYANLEEADFYGFMYLFGAFDGTVIE